MADSKKKSRAFDVEEYIGRLVAEGRQVSALEMVARLGEKLDIAFAAELYELAQRDECCVPGDLLVTYGVLPADDSGANIEQLLGRYELVEEEDYLVCDGGEQRRAYRLHPRAFKRCLMCAKSTLKYARYYILLEEALVHYSKYQAALGRKYCVMLSERRAELLRKDDEIDELKAALVRFENRAGPQPAAWGLKAPGRPEPRSRASWAPPEARPFWPDLARAGSHCFAMTPPRPRKKGPAADKSEGSGPAGRAQSSPLRSLCVAALSVFFALLACLVVSRWAAAFDGERLTPQMPHQ